VWGETVKITEKIVAVSVVIGILYLTWMLTTLKNGLESSIGDAVSATLFLAWFVLTTAATLIQVRFVQLALNGETDWSGIPLTTPMNVDAEMDRKRASRVVAAGSLFFVVAAFATFSLLKLSSVSFTVAIFAMLLLVAVVELKRKPRGVRGNSLFRSRTPRR